MDLSPTVLLVVAIVVLVMLAWAYFDFPGSERI